jgi:hypothetical protein
MGRNQAIATMNPSPYGDIAETAEAGQGSLDHGASAGFGSSTGFGNGLENNGNPSRWLVKVDGRIFHRYHE